MILVLKQGADEKKSRGTETAAYGTGPEITPFRGNQYLSYRPDWRYYGSE